MLPADREAAPRRRAGIPLAPYTTFGIGGPAAELVEVTSGEQLEALLSGDSASGDLTLIGGGSNVLIADRGLDGTTLVMRRPPGPIEPQADRHGVVDLDGAADWPSVADSLAERDIRGTESLCGIPGTVGGAVVQNIGAYGHELAGMIQEVRVFDRRAGRRVSLPAEDCGFGYRTSRFKSADRERFIILGVKLRTVPGGSHEVRYDELARELGDTPPTPGEVRRAVLAIRERKAMVYHPGDPATRGVGSFFTNPVVTPGHFEAVRASAAEEPIPHWTVGQDGVKLSAGWLIEQAGFTKGRRVGNVGLSDRHALAILNVTGRASAAEVIEFARAIRDRVGEVHGVVLTPEPVLLGFGPGDPWG